jgi:hypothetical protein
VGLALALLVLQPRDDVVVRGDADDTLRRIRGGSAPGVDRFDRPRHRAEGRPVLGIHDDVIASPGRGPGGAVVEHIRVRSADRRQLD